MDTFSYYYLLFLFFFFIFYDGFTGVVCELYFPPICDDANFD